MLAILKLLPAPTLETIFMTFASTFFASIMGLPLGAFLYYASPGGLVPRPILYSILSRIVNVLRSFPFIILMIALIPFTRFVVGTSIGPRAVIVPLSIAATPFVARIVESAFSEADSGIVTAAVAMGSSNLQILVKVLLFEALPALVSGLSLTVINLIGYSAMAGAIGGGGLGTLAINYGYYRFQTGVMIAAVIVILVLVELVQLVGSFWSRKLLSKR
ncbi:MAG: ABC transporter permease [Treponema sp.]|jgi:D-methionine transport system permease protein|nr:ABC transporter permease [Treponema sp.]